jgi:hypothetical protein
MVEAVRPLAPLGDHQVLRSTRWDHCFHEKHDQSFGVRSLLHFCRLREGCSDGLSD